MSPHLSFDGLDCVDTYGGGDSRAIIMDLSVFSIAKILLGENRDALGDYITIWRQKLSRSVCHQWALMKNARVYLYDSKSLFQQHRRRYAGRI
jgi:hypothetical protein